MYISFINRNRVLLYLCVYGCISNTFLLYYWISAISLCISLLYLWSHFVPKIIWISGIRAGCSWSFFQCMSPTRSEYSKLGLEFVSLEDNRSHTPKKPSMAEENKNDGANDPISPLLEQALTRQRDEMMENFSHILQRLPIASGAYSSIIHFGDTLPFKLQVNFDIPLFEG